MLSVSVVQRCFPSLGQLVIGAITGGELGYQAVATGSRICSGEARPYARWQGLGSEGSCDVILKDTGVQRSLDDGLRMEKCGIGTYSFGGLSTRR
jgi:hypothetical protein